MADHIVLGGAGFLGSHLVEELLARDRKARVVVVDDMSTGRPENLSHVDQFRMRIVIGDLSSSPDRVRIRREALSQDGFNPKRIWHLASPASPVAYQDNPLTTLRVNTAATDWACTLAANLTARLLFVSTSEVYGDPEVHPQPESYHGRVSTTGQRSCYDEGKRCGEAIVTAWAQMEGIDARIARVFNTYGPRMQLDDGRVVTTFIEQALTGKPITVFGDGSQTRSFCYVDDMVQGLRLLMEEIEGTPRPVNIGNPAGEITVVGLARAINRMCGGKSDIVHERLPQDDPKLRCPDISLATSRLGWSPSTRLGEGLRRTMEWAEAALGGL